MEKYRDPMISMLRVLAMLLIINSHADSLFPKALSFLATGGALGNELFFLLGGYLFSTDKGFWQTNTKRFIRLYLPTYIMTIVLFVSGRIHIADFPEILDWLKLLIWPSSFWFVSAIFLDGMLLWLLDHSGALESPGKALLSTVVFWIVNFLLYHFGIENKTVWIVEDAKLFHDMVYYKCFYSFFVFALGFYLKKKKENIFSKVGEKGLFAAAVLTFLMFYGFKIMMNRQIISMEWQILSQPVTIICVLSIFVWMMNSAFLKKWITRKKLRKDMVDSLGEITLESFLIQFELIAFIAGCRIIFPVNYIIAVILVCIAAWLFHAVVSRLSNILVTCVLKR